MARRKYGTLEMVRREIRKLWDTSFRMDPVTNSARDFRQGLDAALKAVDSAEETEWCLRDLDADQKEFGLR